MSILSTLPDGFGFYYGFREGDYRQINVRYEPDVIGSTVQVWRAYVGGDDIGGTFGTKDEAEACAITWAIANPER